MMPWRRIVAVCLLCIAGCTLGPEYAKPKVQVPDAFRYETASARDEAGLDWWRRFGDPNLDKLMEEALIGNKTARVAAANVAQAQAVLMQVRSPLFPQAQYSAVGANERSSESGSNIAGLMENPQTSWQVLGGASWALDLWGRVGRLSEAAQAELLATEAARRGVLLSLCASVANAYITLLGLDEQLAIAKRTLAAYGESVTLFETQFRHGQVSKITVEQARSQYETAAAAIPDIELQQAQAEHALSLLLGRNPGPIARGRALNDIVPPETPAGLPSEVLARRPDIRQAEQTLIAANARIGAARALYFPSITLTGNLGYASRELGDLFKGPSRVWSYGGTLTGPIFTAGAIAGQVRQAEAAREAALLGYEAAVQTAFADVENALASRRKITDKLKAQERLVEASREYVRLARIQYHAGYAPYSTVLQAEQQCFPAELQHAQSRAALLASLVNLYLALGGGWDTDAAAASDQPPPEDEGSFRN